jgi:hypothetical protein
VRKGHAVKNAVDDAIDRCAVVYNLRDIIEESRLEAEQSTDPEESKRHAHRALTNLRRYFELMVFQAYLQTTDPDSMEKESFEDFVNNRPVIRTFEKELFAEGVHALKPLERADVPDGEALPDEVEQVVKNRDGSILSAHTILKSDFFLNLQKMSLPEYVYRFTYCN